jgi:hypothetical protein
MADYEENFLSVLSEHDLETLLTPAETLKIQGKLWEVLAGRAESYAMGGSSSVRVETAQELLRSAGFVISHGLNHGSGGTVGPEAVRAALLNSDYGVLFKAGLENIKALVKDGEALLETAVKTASAVENAAYRETLRELGVFFRRYHYHHFAHDIPCMLDYPLARPVDEALLGIDYVREYLSRLIVENDLVGRFDTSDVTALLKSISPVYKEDLLNIYEAVAANALALTLLGGDVLSLDVTEGDRKKLIPLFRSWPDDLADVKLRAAAAGLCDILEIGDAPARAYLAETASELYIKVKPFVAFRRLDFIFPSLYREKDEKPSVTYIDNALMDDEKLRALIGALSSCRDVADRIAMAKEHVFSLRDWAEVLNVCFWGDELTALFESLSGDQIEFLWLYLRRQKRKYPDWSSETGWEERLAEYIRDKEIGD